MKKLNYLLFVATMALAFVGCRKPVEVSFDTTLQAINAQGGSIEMLLKSNGEWTINPTAEWIRVTPTAGKGDATLTLTAEANMTGEDRATEVKAVTKDNIATLILTQGHVAQPQHYLTVTPKEFRCGSAGGEVTVEVLSNIDWTVTAPQWITCSVTEGSNNATVILTVNPVDGDYTRFTTYGAAVKGSTFFILKYDQNFFWPSRINILSVLVRISGLWTVSSHFSGATSSKEMEIA